MPPLDFLWVYILVISILLIGVVGTMNIIYFIRRNKIQGKSIELRKIGSKELPNLTK